MIDTYLPDRRWNCIYLIVWQKWSLTVCYNCPLCRGHISAQIYMEAELCPQPKRPSCPSLDPNGIWHFNLHELKTIDILWTLKIMPSQSHSFLSLFKHSTFLCWKIQRLVFSCLQTPVHCSQRYLVLKRFIVQRDFTEERFDSVFRGLFHSLWHNSFAYHNKILYRGKYLHIIKFMIEWIHKMHRIKRCLITYLIEIPVLAT